ncbi:MAG: hypothetical protein QM726_06250 [Chitinophagaceae bacterium]
MKRLFTIFAICLCFTAFSQPVQTLRQRLSGFIEANGAMNLEKVLDYTYPKLFTIAPREQMVEMMKQSFNNEQMSIRLDSLKTDSIYPVFSMQEGSYAKIRYSMKMIMQLKNTDADQKKKDAEAIRAAMQSQLPAGRSFIDSSGDIIIYTSSVMVAAKDKQSKEWTFMNLKDGDQVVTQLFSKEILDKLATYK